MKAIIAADELAKDVAGAEALLERHQEHRVRIDHNINQLRKRLTGKLSLFIIYREKLTLGKIAFALLPMLGKSFLIKNTGLHQKSTKN